MKQSEKVTEKYLVKEMEKIGGQCYKWVSPGRRGVPDRICIFPTSVMICAEIKSEGKPLMPIQVQMHKYLKKLGIAVEVLSTKHEVDRFVLFYSHLTVEYKFTPPQAKSEVNHELLGSNKEVKKS